MRRKIIILSLILILICIMSLAIGRYNLSLLDIWKVIIGQGDKIQKGVFFNIRMPRTLFALFAGGALVLCGFLYQVMFKNPLASPDILGVSSGASIGAIIGILVGSSKYLNVFLAFLCGLLTVFVVLILNKFFRGSKTYNLIIGGIVIGAFANAIIMMLKYMADPERELAVIDYWLMGGLYKIEWLDFYILLGITLPCLVLIIILTKKIRLLTLADDEAMSLGVNPHKLRMIVIILTTIMTATVVSLCGIISWIGLIVPNLVRILFKSSFKETLIYSLFIGAMLLLVSDIISRSISSSEIPISVVTSIIGAFSLIFILVGKKHD